MDLNIATELVAGAGFFAGTVTTATALYSYAKVKGLRLLPLDFENIKLILGNVSLWELGQILATGAKYAKDGFTQKEAQDLGKRIVDAVAEK